MAKSSTLLCAAALVAVGCGGGATPTQTETPTNGPPEVSSLRTSLDTTEARLAPTLSCLGSDPDGDELTYSWTYSGGDMAGFTEDNSAILWIAPEIHGSYDIACAVDDGRGGQASRSVMVTVAPARGLVAHYPFHGSALDASGNAHDGVVSGPSMIEDRFGLVASAFSFDGVDDYIDLGTDSEFKFSGSFSISAWVRLDDLDYPTGSGWIFANTDGSLEPFHAYVVRVSGSGLALNLRNTEKLNQIVSLGPGELRIGEWQHVVAVYDHATRIWSGYFDASQFGTIEFVGQLVEVEQFRSIVGGSYSHVGGHHGTFRGDVDDLRIYARALSLAEIEALFHESGW